MKWTRRKPLRGTRNSLRSMGEVLEPRLVLAVTAAADSYATLEDVGFATGATAVVPRRSQGGWAIFDEIPLVGANSNTYPDANQAPARWYSRAYNINQPSFAAWDTIPNQGLNAPFAYETVTVLAPATPIHAPANLENTVLARKTFALTAEQAAATQMTLDYVCDDGCVVYLNDQEVLRANLPATGAIVPNTLATASGLETAYASRTLDLTTLGVVLHADATNVLAVEVHNIDPASSDLGLDLSLSISEGQAGTRANDTMNAAVGSVNTYYWDGIAATAGTTTAVSGPVTASAGGIQVGTVTINPATGDFRFDPVTTGAGVNYVGNATFQYALRDAATTSTAAVTIAIGAVNDAPVASSDRYSLVRGSGPLSVGANSGNTYVSSGSQWYFSDLGADQHALNPEWVGPASAGFAPESGGETGWNPVPGTAPLGFGDNDEATILSATEVTYYFFRKFNVPETIPSLLRLGLRADDCAAVYINGIEVYRTPTLPYLQGNFSFCTAAIDGLAEDVFEDVAIPTAGLNLLSTDNTISVEVHQASPESTDVVFDLTLRNGLEGVRANDVDADDPTSELTVQVVDQGEFTAEVGSLVVSPNGAFIFTPANANVVGTFSFTYRVVDNGQPTAPAQASREATATIAVLSAPHGRPPQSYSEAYDMLEDEVLTISQAQWPIPLGSEWEYFDEMQNGLQSNPPLPPESYPVDSAADADATPGVSDPWYSEHFNTATSNPAIGTWKTGRAMFAGGIRSMAAGPGRTELLGIGDGAGGLNSVDTYLFRRTFFVEDAASITDFVLYYLIDDGALIHINDNRFGLRLPQTVIGPNTFATGGSDEGYHAEPLLAGAGLFKEGLNTISVEVHQVARESSDVGFDLGLSFTTGAGVLANDENADENPPMTARVVRAPFSGTVAMNSDGTFTYTPNENFSGVDSFEYVAVANGLESPPTPVFINVESTPDPPTASDDTYAVRNNETLDINDVTGVLSNDTGESALKLVLDQSGGEVVAHEAGLFVWNNTNGNFADGSFIFEPTAGFVGSAVFTYTVEDSQGLRDTATVTINVLPSTLPGDLDGDGDIDSTDLATLVGNFGLGSVGLASAELSDGDLNGDGRVGVADAILLRNAIAPGASAPAAVFATARAERAAGVDAVMRRETALWGLVSRRTGAIPGDVDDAIVARRRRTSDSRTAEGSTASGNSFASDAGGDTKTRDTTTGETSLRGRREPARTARTRGARS